MLKNEHDVINSVIKSHTLEMFEKIAIINKNRKEIKDLPFVVKTLKSEDEYKYSPVVHVFDRITDSILATNNTL